MEFSLWRTPRGKETAASVLPKRLRNATWCANLRQKTSLFAILSALPLAPMKYCDVCHSTYPTEFTSCPKDKAALRPLNELAPGMVIRDKYEILEKIGVGGMATVYKARHLTFSEIRAIKVVSNKLMDDETFLKRFKAEAIITRKLRHLNAVQLDDFDTMADGRPFIVMEFVQGRSLRSWINDLGTLPPGRALNITKQVAAALGAAHKLGIVHRDIKPDNIIVIPQPASAPPQALHPAVHLPESLIALLMRGLKKGRDRRFQTAEEFIAAMNKPHVVASATAVLGSDALGTTSTRRHAPSATAARAGVAPARPAGVRPPSLVAPGAPSRPMANVPLRKSAAPA